MNNALKNRRPDPKNIEIYIYHCSILCKHWFSNRLLKFWKIILVWHYSQPELTKTYLYQSHVSMKKSHRVKKWLRHFERNSFKKKVRFSIHRQINSRRQIWSLSNMNDLQTRANGARNILHGARSYTRARQHDFFLPYLPISIELYSRKNREMNAKKRRRAKMVYKNSPQFQSISEYFTRTRSIFGSEDCKK